MFERKWHFYIDDMLGFAKDEVKNCYPFIPWRQIIATRNRLIHGYLGIDNDTLWSIIVDDIPDLHSKLLEIKNKQYKLH